MLQHSSHICTIASNQHSSEPIFPIQITSESCSYTAPLHHRRFKCILLIIYIQNTSKYPRPKPGYCIAKASCSHIVELAREEVRGNNRASREARDFAGISLAHAERGCHVIFKKYGYSVPITVRHMDIGPGNLKSFPYLLFSDWARHLLDAGRLPRQLCGVRTFSEMRLTLQEFWRRYKDLHPDHEVFQMEIDLSVTVPVYSHTDEGRSYKHQPLWVLSTHGCCGRGTKSYIEQKKHLRPLRQREMGLNFVGSTWSSQFMFATALREVLVENEGSMDTILAAYAADMSMLIHEGIKSTDGSYHVRILHLGSKGHLYYIDLVEL